MLTPKKTGTFFGVKRSVVLNVLLILLFASILGAVFYPSWRTGPWGLGLPSQMKTLVGQHVRISIEYPSNWVASETPNGNHGDQEVIATVLVPGRSWPNITIARHISPDENLNQVANWGETRAKVRDGYETTLLQPLNSDNLAGLIREYSWKNESSILGTSIIQCNDWYTLSGNTGYALSLCSEKKDWSDVHQVFQQVMASFSVH